MVLGGYVYLVRLGRTQKHKIGITIKDVSSRVYGIQAAIPTKEVVTCVCSRWFPHARKVEMWLHDTFESCRYVGEWFIMDKTKVNDCVALINEHPKGSRKPPKRKPVKKQEKAKVRFIVAPEESPPVDVTHIHLSEDDKMKAYRRFIKLREELSTMMYVYGFKEDD